MTRNKNRYLTKRNNAQTRRFIFTALFVLLFALGVTSVFTMVHIGREYRAAQREYSALREGIVPASNPPSSAFSRPPLISAEATVPPSDITESTRELLDINPDYIGWIKIDETPIDYPVVQGKDNGQYIHVTFKGEQNASGTIFMDWKCEGAFAAPLAVLFGHNMKDGSMFASLHNYRDNAFLAAHPDISITTPNGEGLTYRIFSVQLTTVADKVFSLFGKNHKEIADFFIEYNAPASATHFLVLSTCTTGGSDNERLLAFAALENNTAN